MRARDAGRESHRRGWSGWTQTAATAPRCDRCGKAHRPDVKCWRGRRVDQLRVAVLQIDPVCWLCGGVGADSIDHVVPRSLGGTDELDNLRPAHRACNARRGNRRGGERAEHIDATSWVL
jgi:5-methylcytosine-specific restriction protein A